MGKRLFDYSDHVGTDLGSWTIGCRDFEVRAQGNPDARSVYELMVAHSNRAACLYCSGPMETVVSVGRPFPHTVEHRVTQCPICGWWAYNRIQWSYPGDDFDAWWYHEGILKEFDLASIDAPLQALRSHLARRFDDVRHIHPRKFEELCARVFADYMDCEVRLTSYSRDGGVDLYALEGEKRWAIQVKRRAESVTEGVAAVREFIGAMVVNGVLAGIFCSTAECFSPAARLAANSPFAKDHGFLLELVDYHRLMEMFSLSATNVSEPWRGLLEKHGVPRLGADGLPSPGRMDRQDA